MKVTGRKYGSQSVLLSKGIGMRSEQIKRRGMKGRKLEKKQGRKRNREIGDRSGKRKRN